MMRIAGVLGTALALLAAQGVSAAPPGDTDAYVAKAMQAFGVPGLSLAIVEDGRTVVAKGYGVRQLGSPAPVDAHTGFPIGSETKAFTAASLAILVDRGKLAWSDRVVDRLPGFVMHDPYATAHMTVRDLLTHRSGLSLGEGDLLIIPGTTRSRADLVHALRYLPPATGFRESFAYDNILYIVAGALVEAVSGQRWEDFVQTNILQPAGMSDAHPVYDIAFPDTAALHARISGSIRGTGPQGVIPAPVGFFEGAAPAGGISTSADDRARWMATQLAHGVSPDGARLWSEAQAKEMWRPVMVVHDEPAPLPIMQPALQEYALGWFVEDYRGHVVIEHAGGVFGGLSLLYLIPDQHVGVSVTINSEDVGALYAVTFHLLDHYLGLPATDWIGELKRVHDQAVEKAEAALKAASAPQAAAGAAALPLSSYVGRYRDPWYGTMSVHEEAPGRLSIRFDETPGMSGELQPLGAERFRAHWGDRNIEDAYVDFVALSGQVMGATMKAVSPLADFSFDYQDLHLTKAEGTGR
jgi:CubicO group peptidase (beta-lactamase class C family)